MDHTKLSLFGFEIVDGSKEEIHAFYKRQGAAIVDTSVVPNWFDLFIDDSKVKSKLSLSEALKWEKANKQTEN